MEDDFGYTDEFSTVGSDEEAQHTPKSRKARRRGKKGKKPKDELSEFEKEEDDLKETVGFQGWLFRSGDRSELADKIFIYHLKNYQSRPSIAEKYLVIPKLTRFFRYYSSSALQRLATGTKYANF